MTPVDADKALAAIVILGLLAGCIVTGGMWLVLKSIGVC